MEEMVGQAEEAVLAQQGAQERQGKAITAVAALYTAAAVAAGQVEQVQATTQRLGNTQMAAMD
jgi:hypothetical protein